MLPGRQNYNMSTLNLPYANLEPTDLYTYTYTGVCTYVYAYTDLHICIHIYIHRYVLEVGASLADPTAGV